MITLLTNICPAMIQRDVIYKKCSLKPLTQIDGRGEVMTGSEELTGGGRDRVKWVRDRNTSKPNENGSEERVYRADCYEKSDKCGDIPFSF
jgi:hypothetical protein